MSQWAALFLLGIFAAASGNIARFNEESQATPPSPLRHAVTFVDCYDCVGCEQINDKTNIKTCPYVPDILKAKTCVKYAEAYHMSEKVLNHSWVIRGCASEKGSCNEIRQRYKLNPDVDLDYCTECEGDKCNGVSRSLSDMFVAFVAVIFVPIFGKFIAS